MDCVGTYDIAPCFKKHVEAEELCVTQAEYELNPLTAWATGGYPTLDTELRLDCSAKCAKKTNLTEEDIQASPEWGYVCEPENWSAVKTFDDWAPEDGLNCNSRQYLNADDPDGSEIDWTLVGGSTSSVPLENCSLEGDCVDWFYPPVGGFVVPPGISRIIEPETRYAHYLGVEGSGSELELNMQGGGPGVDDTEPLFGVAEYTASDCGDEVCPFYLANLNAWNTTDPWDVRILTVAGNLKKTISNVQIDLVQSTLGVHNTVLGKVAFAPGALRLRVELEISSCPTCDDTADGTHIAVVENDEVVFAGYDDGDLTIDHTFDLPDGSATLTVSVLPDEFPPEADHDLGATETCDDQDGLVLDENRAFSSDPDDDITGETWWVDGELCVHGCVVPPGSHEIVLHAWDARGAHHRTEPQWVFVQAACGVCALCLGDP